jgi:hypothetical protein
VRRGARRMPSGSRDSKHSKQKPWLRCGRSWHSKQIAEHRNNSSFKQQAQGLVNAPSPTVQQAVGAQRVARPQGRSLAQQVQVDRGDAVV